MTDHLSDAKLALRSAFRVLVVPWHDQFFILVVIVRACGRSSNPICSVITACPAYRGHDTSASEREYWTHSVRCTVSTR
jgi:hypothetical protein